MLLIQYLSPLIVVDARIWENVGIITKFFVPGFSSQQIKKQDTRIARQPLKKIISMSKNLCNNSTVIPSLDHEFSQEWRS